MSANQKTGSVTRLCAVWAGLLAAGLSGAWASGALLAGATPYVPLRSAEVFIDGPQLQDQLIGLAREARSSLSVEFLSFYGDEQGWKVAQALGEAAQRGVAVRVLIDSLYYHTSSNRSAPADPYGPGMIDAMRAAGVQVLPSNRFRHGNGPIQRDHRKLVAADGRKGIITGYQPGDTQYGWHDVGIVVEGPEIVSLLEQAFAGSWEESDGRPGPASPPAASGEGWTGTVARLNLTDPSRGESHGIRDTNIARIDSARGHVYVENAFFTDSRVFAALERAAARGVDVRVVFSKNNVHLSAQAGARHHYARLLAAGVKVYERPGMSHTKALSVDGAWASVGSANMMPMLEEAQDEISMEFTGGELARELESKLFAADFAASEPITAETLHFTAVQHLENGTFTAVNRVIADVERFEQGFKSELRELARQ
ncbi:MAG: phosphatidylserine/phosphatidylglycerophosphate/cardiolipin synthase family protein [Elusimicrobia bacterium]|nr:phosphatidylserine/phosphatidylglycerophosphate/cardiolipin synthase family protein [Elusimicrobiota bacterium]